MTHRYLERTMHHCAHLAILLGATALFGCEGEVRTVGEADDTSDTESDTKSDTEQESTAPQDNGPDPNCAAQDAEASANYENWLAEANDFEDEDGVNLLGKTFQGYIEGGDDMTLQIEEDGSALLFVGELVSLPVPIKDKGYLCGAPGSEAEGLCFDAPMVGISYEIRGATLTNGRLVVPIQEDSPYDAWCQLQTPILSIVETEHSDAVACVFGLVTNEGGTFSPSTNTCTLGGRAYDCSWLETAMWPDTHCECTSSACFATIRANPALRLDARIGEVAGEITGSLVGHDGPVPIHLFETAQ